ncbi:hypothetical protein ASC77_08820 [Nocardioides sp. Root1257]|nr:hypothetical protein ASC77_08820 [Nocardioides sp. Root1257]KRC47998.1 hypothetical protein ASE24_08825 [Nocardioides sp. Root224]
MAEMVATSSPAASALTGAVDRSALEPPLALAFASDLRLVADAVAVALTSRGFQVQVLSWPRTSGAEPVQRQLADLSADVAVLLYDVDMSIRMAEAVALLRSWSGPWLVLTGVSPGPAWGGLTLAGAAAVRSSDISLADVADLVRRLAAGEPDPSPDVARYVESWRAVQTRHGDIQRRIDSLAPRELEVLTLLYQGVRVDAIARRLGLSVATVRSQVRAILRKLDARSQLSAVALLHAIDGAT